MFIFAPVFALLAGCLIGFAIARILDRKAERLLVALCGLEKERADKTKEALDSALLLDKELVAEMQKMNDRHKSVIGAGLEAINLLREPIRNAEWAKRRDALLSAHPGKE